MTPAVYSTSLALDLFNTIHGIQESYGDAESRHSTGTFVLRKIVWSKCSKRFTALSAARVWGSEMTFIQATVTSPPTTKERTLQKLKWHALVLSRAQMALKSPMQFHSKVWMALPEFSSPLTKHLAD